MELKVKTPSMAKEKEAVSEVSQPLFFAPQFISYFCTSLKQKL